MDIKTYYKLINNQTNEQYLCTKILLDSNIYYISETDLKIGDFVFLDNKPTELGILGKSHIIQILQQDQLESAIALRCPKVIADIDSTPSLPIIIDTPTQEDSINFIEWAVKNVNPIFPNCNRWKMNLRQNQEVSTREVFQEYKKQHPIVIRYN